ncbi:MAG: winged helix DNA-binding domain-containing protein [Thermoleophilia bacterium]|nr:winged helix DNA-binding domain-containing protein [Thermoleophilia bacterium]
MTLRELNRTLLLRQMLLERRRTSALQAVKKLVALQAQYAPSPYVALWSRVEGFRKAQLSRNAAIVKAGCFRTTLHVVARAEFPYVVSSYIESQRGRSEGLGVDIEALRAAVPDRPLSSAELTELARRVLETDDRWIVAFAYRALPFVRTEPAGPWPHTKPSPLLLWREPLPDAQESSTRVVRQYLGAYGPASRDDVVQFTGFRLRQVDPALDGLRTFEDEEGRVLYDVPRAPLAEADAVAPVRFLPAFDSIILAHRDRSRIVPPEYVEAVFNKKNATTKNTFTVDGFVAGAWRIEQGKLRIEPFAPLPPKVRRAVEAEGERLLAWYASS